MSSVRAKKRPPQRDTRMPPPTDSAEPPRWTLPMPATAAPGARVSWLRFKRGFDVMAAATMLLASAPVLLASLLVVRMTSRGPALYSQRRVGLDGREFTIFKVRSMRIDAESCGGPRWCVPGDQRVTAVGRVLRKLHIDELPQLWNVLRGEMSLVGPRPERPEFMPKLRAFVRNYDARHAVLPGITGLAQVQVGADTDVENVVRKLRYDLHYVRHQGPWLEAQIYGCTAAKVLGVSLASLRRWMALGFDDQPGSTAHERRAA